MIKITLADGSVREMEDGSSVLDAAKSISDIQRGGVLSHCVR